MKESNVKFSGDSKREHFNRSGGKENSKNQALTKRANSAKGKMNQPKGSTDSKRATKTAKKLSNHDDVQESLDQMIF